MSHNSSTMTSYRSTDDTIDVSVSGERRYWKISPGVGAGLWSEFQRRDVIAVEWKGTPDLEQAGLSSGEDVRRLVDKIEELRSAKLSHVARQLWYFYSDMRPGDLVCAYGHKQVLGWGKIDGYYRFEQDELGFPHRRPVQWCSTRAISTSGLSVELGEKLQQRATIIELDEAEFSEIQQAAYTGSSGFDRSAEQTARMVLEELLPEVEVRTACLSLLADSIRHAHQLSPGGWGITLFPDAVRLNVGRISGLPILRDRIYVTVDASALSEQDLQALGDSIGHWEKGGSSVPGEVASVRIRPNDVSSVLPQIHDAHLAVIERASKSVTRTPYHNSHSPGVIKYLRSYLQQDLSQPSYSDGADNSHPIPTVVPGMTRTLLSRRGFYFTPWQIATFYTALQVKGFVVLSGISGTGKTKLAQEFAELLPQPSSGETAVADDVIALTVRPYMVKYGQITIPKWTARLIELPAAGEKWEVKVSFEDQAQTCRLSHPVSGNTGFVELVLRGPARTWFKSAMKVDDLLVLDPELDDDRRLTGFRMLRAEEYRAVAGGTTRGSNLLFVPVRPDWRDSKNLLGYYNPLMGTYEWTDFTRFLLRAWRSYRDGDGLAWFVVLDEMNLAHVEYYFADLLSVLESGRYDDGDMKGLTREPLRFSYPEDAEGDLPPRELRLPPNLYVVGTVNVDETTHAFSPKVLDRAFTLELTDVDFTSYPPELVIDGGEPSDEERRAILKAFTQGGAFGRVDKGEIASYVAVHPEVRYRLQRLNELLRPHNLHFGYRVFDEIVTFLYAADRNWMFMDLEGVEPAFDAAVLMKVLPKFHGSRSKLEAPLHALLAWCANPDAPNTAVIAAAVIGADQDITTDLSALSFRFPLTARRAWRMLRELYTDGFAAFG